MGEASELLHSRLGIEDPELVILNVNLKSREGCTESVRFDKCTHGPSLPALPPFGRQGLWLRHNKLREGTEKCNDEVKVTLIHLFSEILKKKEKTIAKLICYGFNSMSKRLVA